MAQPKQVKKQTRAANKQHKQVYEVPAAADPAAAPAEGDTPEVPAAAPAAAEGAPQAAAPAAQPAPPVNDAQKYATLQGKYDAEVPRLQTENQALAQQVSGMQQVLASMQAPVAQEVQPGEPLLKQAEIDDYGAELIDVIRRTAREEFIPQISQLQSDNENLRTTLGSMSTGMAESARGSLFNQLDDMMPTWQTVNKSPEFLDWLRGRDVYSGTSRQAMLTQAFEAGDAARVLAFFRGYSKEQTVVQTGTQNGGVAPSPLDTLVAPGQPLASGAASAPQGHMWTQSDINEFYRDVNSGKFKGREAQKANIEADLIAASTQGRIIG